MFLLYVSLLNTEGSTRFIMLFQPNVAPCRFLLMQQLSSVSSRLGYIPVLITIKPAVMGRVTYSIKPQTKAIIIVQWEHRKRALCLKSLSSPRETARISICGEMWIYTVVITKPEQDWHCVIKGLDDHLFCRHSCPQTDGLLDCLT